MSQQDQADRPTPDDLELSPEEFARKYPDYLLELAEDYDGLYGDIIREMVHSSVEASES